MRSRSGGGVDHLESVGAPGRLLRLEPATSSWRRGIASVRVFGSMARGDADDASDVDLLVELPEGVSGLALGGLLLDAQDLLGRKVDVVTEDAFPLLLRRTIVEQAVPL